MEYLLDKVRDILGSADFYIEGSNYSSTWDYGAMLEYVICGCLLIISVVFAFKFLLRLIG